MLTGNNARAVDNPVSAPRKNVLTNALVVVAFLLFGGVRDVWKANAGHKKLNDVDEGSAIFLDELDKVRTEAQDTIGTSLFRSEVCMHLTDHDLDHL